MFCILVLVNYYCKISKRDKYPLSMYMNKLISTPSNKEEERERDIQRKLYVFTIKARRRGITDTLRRKDSI